ncbi:PucR family transcriptional regulator [Paraburkholderia lycopersici]|uniref:Sugar diacid utilization regulator n=1 Tax=Paraburkholderia lycopersici TaxID=416944 RepID=A0A1G6TKC0_9BURK|nr:helix-turn-helix domain-containing protein [Paraburkholderia lycopersici]SDD29538.1 Sugar diacid utilization regulator [Paraburkholderia lycopersici]
MPPPVPPVSTRLRSRLRTLAKTPPKAVERTYETLLSLEGYSALTAAARKDIFASIAFSANLWFQCLLDGSPPTTAVMEQIAAFARRRVHQNVPLRSLLRAFRLGARELWRTCTEFAEAEPTLAHELLFEISPYLLDYFDAMAEHIAEAYLDEQHQQARWRGSLLQQLYDLVFHAPDDAARFRETVEALGLDATLPRIALAVDLDLRDHAPSVREDALDRFALSAARHFELKPDALVRAWHRERLVFWLPCVRGDSMTRNDQRAAEHAGALARAEPRVRSIGIGLMNEGAHGWAASVEEALKAVDFAPRGSGTGDEENGNAARVHRFSSIAIEESVRSSANVLRYLVSLAGQLATEADLLATLEAWFASGQRRRQTAEALGVHPNTLDYRLERIETLLGAKLDDAHWIARLDIALKLRGATQGAERDVTKKQKKERGGAKKAKSAAR